MTYIVLNEHTLGYLITPGLLGVLSGSVFSSGHNPLNGPVVISPGIDTVRPATREDFKSFRVCSIGHLDPIPSIPNSNRSQSS